MPVEISYKVSIGNLIASSKMRENHCQLLSLYVEHGMDSLGGKCIVEVSTDTSAPEINTPLKVELDNGEGSKLVFKGEVVQISSSAYSMLIHANDGLMKLANLDIESVYEDVSAGFIVSDLLSQAGLKKGQVEDGPNFPSYVLQKGPRALRHIQSLSSLCGADLFTTGDGLVHFSQAKTGSADHTFTFSENVLNLDLKPYPYNYDGLEIYGEGSASSKGSEKYYWLSTDLSSTRAVSSLGDSGTLNSGKKGTVQRLETFGCIRSGEDAQKVADAKLQAKASKRVRGELSVFAKPGVEPGDLISIKNIPEGHSAKQVMENNNTLRARMVKYELDRKRGFITRMVF